VGEAERITRQREQQRLRRQEAEDRAAAVAERQSKQQLGAVARGYASRAVSLLSQQGWPEMTMIVIHGLGRRGRKSQEMACRRIGTYPYKVRGDDVTGHIYLTSTGQVAFGGSLADFNGGFGSDRAHLVIDGLRRLIAALEG
jgi:hypothetical protein